MYTQKLQFLLAALTSQSQAMEGSANHGVAPNWFLPGLYRPQWVASNLMGAAHPGVLCRRATQWQVHQENHLGFPQANLDHLAAGISTPGVSARGCREGQRALLLLS